MSDSSRCPYILAVFSTFGALNYFRVLTIIRQDKLHRHIIDRRMRRNLDEIEAFTQKINIVMMSLVSFICLAVIFITIGISHVMLQPEQSHLFIGVVLIGNAANTALLLINIISSFWLSSKV